MKKNKAFYLIVMVAGLLSTAGGVVIDVDQADTDALSSVLSVDVIDDETINVSFTKRFEDETDYLMAKAFLSQKSRGIGEALGDMFSCRVLSSGFSFDDGKLSARLFYECRTTAGVLSISEIPGEYTVLLPLYFDLMEVRLPEGYFFHSADPGPNKCSDDRLVYYDFDWRPEIKVTYGKEPAPDGFIPSAERIKQKLMPINSVDVRRAFSGESSLKFTEQSGSVYGRNEFSHYLIPKAAGSGGSEVEYKAYFGSDLIDSAGTTASAVAGMYQPVLMYGGGTPNGEEYQWCPDALYYRVIQGWDPYARKNSYLIMYYLYYKKQCCEFSNPLDSLDVFGLSDIFGVSDLVNFKKNHENDYTPLFMWVENIGNKPYRIAYDRYDPIQVHFHQVHKTYWSVDVGHYLEGDIGSVYTQDSGYFPQGRMAFTGDNKELEIGTMNEVRFQDATHCMLRIPNCYHSLDNLVNSGTSGQCYGISLQSLTDEKVREWYTTEGTGTGCSAECNAGCAPNNFCAFTHDISDPFHGLFWEDPNSCTRKIPETKITSVEDSYNGDMLEIDVRAEYGLSSADGSRRAIRGLWEDNFRVKVSGIQIEDPESITELSPGRYLIKIKRELLG
ncbi:MAG: hypothetical protein JW724_01805 [Candidatus Altiarchaeota archaeon]|nr:hypothetical protein [Candidatus Altiarchaeota archaeon]